MDASEFESIHPRDEAGKFADKPVEEAVGGLDALSGPGGMLARMMNCEFSDEGALAEAQARLDAAEAQARAERERQSVEIVKSDPSREQVEAMLAAGVSKELRIWETCLKCGGTGSVSWGADVDGVVHVVDSAGRTRGTKTIPRVCFDCNGPGGKSTTLGALGRRYKDRDRREMKRAQKAEKKAAEQAAKAAAEQAEIAAKRAEFESAHQEVVEALKTIPGEFGLSLREQLDARGELTDKQMAAVLRIAAEKAKEPEPSPVIEGRIEMTGTVVSTKWVESQYGSTMKMVMLDDRGFKVFGSVPTSLMSENYYDENGNYQHRAGVERGDRVSFTATNERSDDDETFGFFKRPSKATLEKAPQKGPDLEKGRELAQKVGATNGSPEDRAKTVVAAVGDGRIAQEDLMALHAWIEHDTNPKNFDAMRVVEHFGVTRENYHSVLQDALENDEISVEQLRAAAAIVKE